MRLLAALTCSALLAWAPTALAATVVVLRPLNPSPQAVETITLLQGELASVGLEDTTIERPAAGASAGTDLRPWFERLAGERGAIAVIDLLGEDGVGGVDVWVRKSPGRFEVTRIMVQPDTTNSAARVAIRTLEALRASLVELELAARYLRRRQNTAQPSVVRAPAPAKPREPPRKGESLGLEIGSALVMSPGGVGPAVLPSLRFDWAVRPRLLVDVTLAALGTQPSITTQTGSASIAREFALLGGCYRPWSERAWWPFSSIAVGALHTAVRGRAGVDMNRHDVGTWSFLMDLGLGVTVRFRRPYHITLSGHAQVAHPYVAIHFGDPVVATLGRANLLLTLAVGAWL